MKLDKKMKTEKIWWRLRRIWRTVKTTRARRVGGRRSEWLNERKTARYEVKWRENNMKNPISSLQTPHMLLRVHTHVHGGQSIFTSAAARTNTHGRPNTHTHTNTHRWMLVCSLCNYVCLPIMMNSFKTLMQQHLDIQHSKSFFSHGIWKLWSHASHSQISNHPSWKKSINYTERINFKSVRMKYTWTPEQWS